MWARGYAVPSVHTVVACEGLDPVVLEARRREDEARRAKAEKEKADRELRRRRAPKKLLSVKEVKQKQKEWKRLMGYVPSAGTAVLWAGGLFVLFCLLVALEIV